MINIPGEGDPKPEKNFNWNSLNRVIEELLKVKNIDFTSGPAKELFDMVDQALESLQDSQNPLSVNEITLGITPAIEMTLGMSI